VSPSPQSVSESHTQVSGMQRFVICQTKYSIRIYNCNIRKLWLVISIDYENYYYYYYYYYYNEVTWSDTFYCCLPIFILVTCRRIIKCSLTAQVKCDGLQVVLTHSFGFSSVPSEQSLSPSQTQYRVMHRLLSQRNWSSRQRKFSEPTTKYIVVCVFEEVH